MSLSAADLERIIQADPELGRALVEKLEAETEKDRDPPYIEGLFDRQKEFVFDPAKKKAALCSRRAGKTESVAAWLLQGAEETPASLSVYICLSRNNARLILWATLQAINERYSLKLWFRERDNQLIVQLPNKSQIWLAGCKDSAEIEKFRGIKLKRAAIDEAGSFGSYLRDLVFDVLEPALLDLDGDLCMIGTPAAMPTGLFFEITTGAGLGSTAAKQWSTHHWTTLQNPHIQLNKLSPEEQKKEIEESANVHYINERARLYLENKCEQNNWDEAHPTFQREWLGKWVRDDGALVYPYDPDKNSYLRLPEADRWTYAIGVDVGYEDSTAFVVGAYRKNHPEVYICHVEKRNHLIPSAMAAHLERLQKKFKAYQVIIDSGGLGKAYAEECAQRYGIYCEPAQKRNKRAFIEIIRGELLSGSIKINPHACSQLLNEMVSLVWDEKHEAPDDRFEDHACDAFLYLVRALLPTYRPQIDPRPLSYKEKAAAEMKEHRRTALREVKARLTRRMKTGQVMMDISSGQR